MIWLIAFLVVAMVILLADMPAEARNTAYCIAGGTVAACAVAWVVVASL